MSKLTELTTSAVNDTCRQLRDVLSPRAVAFVGDFAAKDRFFTEIHPLPGQTKTAAA